MTVSEPIRELPRTLFGTPRYAGNAERPILGAML